MKIEDIPEDMRSTETQIQNMKAMHKDMVEGIFIHRDRLLEKGCTPQEAFITIFNTIEIMIIDLMQNWTTDPGEGVDHFCTSLKQRYALLTKLATDN